MIEYPEPTPIPREPHELPAMLEQAAFDVAADFGIWRFQSRQVIDTHQMPAQEAWLKLLKSMEALEAVLCEIEAAS